MRAIRFLSSPTITSLMVVYPNNPDKRAVQFELVDDTKCAVISLTKVQLEKLLAKLEGK